MTLLLSLLASLSVLAASPYPPLTPAPAVTAALTKWPVREADFLVDDFRFRSDDAITAPVTLIDSADDFINPRNLDIPQSVVARMQSARFRLITESAATRGHETHTRARFWQADFADLLARTGGGVSR